MHPFRLNHWRRVHRPILFIFLCALCLLGLVETTRFDPNSRTTPVQGQNVQENVKTMTSTSTSPTTSGIGDDLLIVSSHEDLGIITTNENIFDDENLIPVPVVPKQLPFCKTAPQGNKANNNNETPLQPPHTFETTNNETLDELVPSKQNGLKAGKLIVVATMDGNLSLMDHGGKILWTICTGHFFSSTISTLQLRENGKYVKLIPSLTGGLYKYDGDSLHAMPLNADSLLKRSFKLSNEVVITGGKELRTFGVEINSGNLRYECGMEGCNTPAKAELKSDDDANPIVLVINKHLQTVRAIDSFTGTERWNFSVGNHELALAGVTEGCYQPAEEVLDYENKKKHLFKMLIPDGIIFGADAENKIVWQHKFDSPISQAWTLEKGRLQIVDPIMSAPLVDENPTLYVGIHKQQLYVQESHTTTTKLKSKLQLEALNGESGFNQKTIEWRPSGAKLAISGSGTESDNNSTALASFYDGPFFVYDRDEIGFTPTPAIEAPLNFSEGDNLNINLDEDEIVMIGLSTLWFWWKEVLGISLLTAVILNILLLRPMMRFVRQETVIEMRRFFGNLINRERQERQALLPRTSTSDESILTERTRTVSSSSSQSHSGLMEDQTTPFISQYLREFEPIQCLGRGGFGVVFEARKKIDDRTYAVKRIALPNSEKSRDRVMREVKALAKLDHKNIVRYFNAWIESPPIGWLEKSDPLWNCGALSSPSPTCDYPSNSFIGSGEGDSSSMFKPIGGNKKGHLEISVPDKTPVDDDSFIVFESNSIDEDEDKSVKFQPNQLVRNRSVSVSIRTDSIDSLSCSESDSYSNPNNIQGSCSNSIIPFEHSSRFFARPTTLNIPSSTDSNSWGKDPDTENNNNNNNNNSSNNSSNGELVHESLSIMYLYIQQELCQKRTLQEWLRAEKERNLRHVVRIFAQIVEAVEYIHSHNLIHRDLKPSNIFLAGETGKDDEMTAKIGDFGLATTLVRNKLNEEPQTPQEGDGPSNHDPTNVKLTGHVGTHLYMSPEQNQHKPYDYKVDIYSLGLIFLELLVPFSTEMERYDLLSRVRKLNFPNVFCDSHPEEYKLIKQMVSHKPNKRPDTSEIKLWLKNRIETLKFVTPNTIIPTLRSKSFPCPIFVDEAVETNCQVGEKHQQGKHFYKAHSLQ